jgi:hypothetical protein
MNRRVHCDLSRFLIKPIKTIFLLGLIVMLAMGCGGGSSGGGSSAPQTVVTTACLSRLPTPVRVEPEWSPKILIIPPPKSWCI